MCSSIERVLFVFFFFIPIPSTISRIIHTNPHPTSIGRCTVGVLGAIGVHLVVLVFRIIIVLVVAPTTTAWLYPNDVSDRLLTRRVHNFQCYYLMEASFPSPQACAKSLKLACGACHHSTRKFPPMLIVSPMIHSS